MFTTGYAVPLSMVTGFFKKDREEFLEILPKPERYEVRFSLPDDQVLIYFQLALNKQILTDRLIIGQRHLQVNILWYRLIEKD